MRTLFTRERLFSLVEHRFFPVQFWLFIISGMATASPAGDVIVWEWKQESNLWIPYQECVCQLLEKKFMELRQNTSKKMLPMVNLGECDPSLDCYEVDLVSWEQIRYETGAFLASEFTVSSLYG